MIVCRSIYTTVNSTGQDCQEGQRYRHETCIQAKEALPCYLICPVYIMSRRNYFLPDLYRQYRRLYHREARSAYFLIPPPPIGPPLAAKSQFSIPPYRIPGFVPNDPDGVQVCGLEGGRHTSLLQSLELGLLLLPIQSAKFRS